MGEIIAIVIGSLFVSNVILSNFLGICPFLGISKKPSNAIGMGFALVFVVVLSATICYCIERFILQPLGLDYLQLIVFILVIASFVQLVEFFMKKYMKSLYKALGIYLPLITTNCVVLNVALAVTGNGYNFIQTMVYAISISLGYTLVITLFSAIRVRLDSNEALPAPFKGNPIALITAALMALAFLGFAGILQ